MVQDVEVINVTLVPPCTPPDEASIGNIYHSHQSCRLDSKQLYRQLILNQTWHQRKLDFGD
jgi:hypothetical protein